MATTLESISLAHIYEDFRFPDGEAEFNLDFYNPTETYIQMPYSIRNQGFYNLRSVNLEISLKFNFFQNSEGNFKDIIFFSSQELQELLIVGKNFNGVFYRDFSYFNWESIGFFLTEDNIANVSIFMELEFSFYFEGVSKTSILMLNKNVL